MTHDKPENNDVKRREFCLNLDAGDFWHVDDRNPPSEYSHCCHVIEYSAYQALIQERDTAVTERAKCYADYHKLEIERDEMLVAQSFSILESNELKGVSVSMSKGPRAMRR